MVWLPSAETCPILSRLAHRLLHCSQYVQQPAKLYTLCPFATAKAVAALPSPLSMARTPVVALRHAAAPDSYSVILQQLLRLHVSSAAVILWNNSEPDLARDHFLAFKKIFSSAAAEVQAADSDVQEQDSRLSRLLGSA